ncbi:hypothetical protein [Natronoglycomyces albus]|uniref:Uncharacterized protein n=1 Tax=Natronoglycomyces albus TaxID=2811108 RepID=A0A895XPS8_9ACTN|nr:hypothetical protein [Natronoglycomyces albus]QSB05742.1 hypothetical protein JQS30_02090 [Natronoglycomyces albus]
MGRHQDKSKTDDTSASDSLDLALSGTRSKEADRFWEQVGVDPIVIHLGKNSGLTLRAYKAYEPEDLDEELDEDTDDDAEPAKGQAKNKRGKKSDEDDRPDIENPEDVDNFVEPDISDFVDEDTDDDTEETTPKAERLDVDEVPVFLSKNGKVLLFDTREALVKYVKSQAKHDLTQIETFAKLKKGLKAEYVVCDEADNFELDLVVTNLRGGHDAWEPELLISAGEIARDLGQALDLRSVTEPLAEGSPLDDIDESLRTIVDGGFRSFFAKRKLRRVSTEQAAIAWRGIIGKISEAVHWRKDSQ